jgi:hypothetical protein
MKDVNYPPEDLQWHCDVCRKAMEVGPVVIEYMDHRFTVELPRCPGCGKVLISEELATGRMAEVEQILEDK